MKGVEGGAGDGERGGEYALLGGVVVGISQRG